MNDYVKNKLGYTMIGLVIIAMVIWIIVGTRQESLESDTAVNQETYTMESVSGSNTVTSESASTGYFLVKAEDGRVNVYWMDQSGQHIHLETSIAFDLLNNEDQAILENGVKIETEEELASFLENYDS